MDNKEKILSILKLKGPNNPAGLSKEVGQNTLITSSLLSELSTEKKVMISHVKFGSSPFYYLPEQKPMLEKLSMYLNEKDKRTYDKLKSEKILRESEMDALTKVSIREIKDYAVGLNINFKGQVEMFWRYFSITQDDAIKIIKERYFPSIKNEIKENLNEIIKEIPKEVSKKTIEMDKTNKIDEKIDTKQNTDSFQSKQTSKNEYKQKKLIDESIEVSDDFVSELKKNFNQRKIDILDMKIIRKNSEVDMIIKVPSQIGNLEFYCKAKSKKRVNDGDLSSAYISGQSKKLPVLFVTNGKLTKRAQEMSENEFKNNFTILMI